MGLDITYYKVARPLTSDERANLDAISYDERVVWSEENNIQRLYVNPNFPGRDAGLPSDWVFAVVGGSFRAGSYSGYNIWRSQLAAMVGHDVFNPPPAGPFMELIHFADNEGVIGPIVSAKLAADFEVWQARAEVFAGSRADEDNGGWFLRKYGEWRTAFTEAARGGYVDFH